MKKLILGLLPLFFILLIITNCTPQKTVKKLSDKERMEWWHNAKFGMFIHFGVYSQWAGVYHGHQQQRGGAEWIMNRCKIPVAEYQERAKNFNPVKYNPEEWVKMAKNAGMKYIIITSKHHDGFALFDSKASNWNVVKATKYGKDLLKPLAKACKKYDIKLGFYYSQAQDWNNPGGAVSRRLMKEGWPNPDSTNIDNYTAKHDGHWDPSQETATFDEYIDRVAVPQVREILSNYGNIAVLWWDTPTHMTDEIALKLQGALKLQPNIITNDRLKQPNFKGDTKTPEQHIPDQKALTGQNWETCMTMNGSWGYRDDNKWKSNKTLIRNLVDIASKGGNFLLNVGPKPDGTFPQQSIERLKAIGDWMHINSESIYKTQSSPFDILPWGRCTQKTENKNTILYFSVFDWPKNGELVISSLKNEVLSAKLLANGNKLQTKKTDDGIIIEVPETAPDSIASVIKVVVKNKVASLILSDKKKEMKTGSID